MWMPCAEAMRTRPPALPAGPCRQGDIQSAVSCGGGLIGRLKRRIPILEGEATAGLFGDHRRIARRGPSMVRVIEGQTPATDGLARDAIEQLSSFAPVVT